MVLHKLRTEHIFIFQKKNTSQQLNVRILYLFSQNPPYRTDVNLEHAVYNLHNVQLSDFNGYKIKIFTALNARINVFSYDFRDDRFNILMNKKKNNNNTVSYGRDNRKKSKLLAQDCSPPLFDWLFRCCSSGYIPVVVW